MKNMYYYATCLGLALFFMAGCATIEIVKEGPAETATEKPVEKPRELSPLDSCADTLTSLVEEARKTMRSTETLCSGLRFEATPMWDMNYDGTVHVRVYDTEGKSVLDEMRKPQK